MVNGVEIDEIALYNRVLNPKDVDRFHKVDPLYPLFKNHWIPLLMHKELLYMMST